MGLNIGIDLGTTFSAVAAVDRSGRPVIVKNADGNSTTPSVIYFDGEPPIVGDEAKEMQAVGQSDIASFFKRSMGDNSFLLNLDGRNYTPTDLSAIVLKHLKDTAETQLGGEITHAVITVPAYFNNFQREATIKAGQMAGLNILRIINEPTAAALAYGLERKGKDQTLLVYDLGGGTFDVTVVKITKKHISVIATDGDHELGGKDWDDRISTYLGQRFKEDYKLDPLDDAESFQDLLIRTENAKRQLSLREKVNVSIVHAGEKKSYPLTRDHFEEMTRDLLERTGGLIEQVMTDSRLQWHDIDGVLLVGGSTRMPMVHRFVESISGKKPLSGVNVDEAVALGAAIQANIDMAETKGNKTPIFSLAGKKKTRDVISHSLGMVAEKEDRSCYINSIIIPKNNPIPSSQVSPFKIRTSKNQENQVEVYMLQGENESPLKCDILGKYVFSGIQHSANQTAILDIQYQYDRSGVVSVSSVQRGTKKSLHLTIEPVPDDLSWLSAPPPPEEEQVVKHVSIFLAIDVSYSMGGPPFEEAQNAARSFVKECDLAHMSVGITQFGSSAEVIIPPSRSAREIENAINRLSIKGSTNMTDGIKVSHLQLKKADSLRYIILFTDGMPDDVVTAEKASLEAREEGIEIIAIGTGGADENYLKKISSSDTHCLFAQSGTVVETFSKIAQELTESKRGK